MIMVVSFGARGSAALSERKLTALQSERLHASILADQRLFTPSVFLISKAIIASSRPPRLWPFNIHHWLVMPGQRRNSWRLRSSNPVESYTATCTSHVTRAPRAPGTSAAAVINRGTACSRSARLQNVQVSLCMLTRGQILRRKFWPVQAAVCQIHSRTVQVLLFYLNRLAARSTSLQHGSWLENELCSLAMGVSFDRNISERATSDESVWARNV